MSLSRSGFELNEIWEQQMSLVEADEERRKRERAAARGDDPDARAALRAHLTRARDYEGLIRNGFSGDVMAHHVREHAHSYHAWHEARDADRLTDEHTMAWNRSRHAVRQHYQDHGDHPADHVKRGESESPREFATRLTDLAQGNHSVRGSYGEHSHSTISYDNHRDEDKGEHHRKRDAMARAWDREVPAGHTDTGDRTGYDHSTGGQYVKGSYIHFRTGPRDPQRPRPRR